MTTFDQELIQMMTMDESVRYYEIIGIFQKAGDLENEELRKFARKEMDNFLHLVEKNHEDELIQKMMNYL